MVTFKTLFVGSRNGSRSMMAKALLNQLGKGRFSAESAGFEPGEQHPLAVQVMKEIGLDIAGDQPKSVFSPLLRRPEIPSYHPALRLRERRTLSGVSRPLPIHRLGHARPGKRARQRAMPGSHAPHARRPPRPYTGVGEPGARHTAGGHQRGGQVTRQPCSAGPYGWPPARSPFSTRTPAARAARRRVRPFRRQHGIWEHACGMAVIARLHRQ